MAATKRRRQVTPAAEKPKAEEKSEPTAPSKVTATRRGSDGARRKYDANYNFQYRGTQYGPGETLLLGDDAEALRLKQIEAVSEHIEKK